MTRRLPRDATDTELSILQVIWDRGEATRRDIADVLYPGGAVAHYATVQKLLERLEAKGFVRRKREDGVLTFSAAVDREALIQLRLHEVAEKLCGGSLTPLLMNLVRTKPLNSDELEELQTLIGELRKQAKARGRGG